MSSIKRIADEIAEQSFANGWNKTMLAYEIEKALRNEQERCAKAICLFCAEPEHYGPPKEIEGSKQLWHSDLRNDRKGMVQCQAAAIRKED